MSDPLEQAARELKADKWISVKDRIPSAEGDYMVWIDGSGDRGDITPGVRAPFYFFKKCGKFRDDVTHWQPLPESPTAQQKGRAHD
jgi:hypothetical protein